MNEFIKNGLVTELKGMPNIQYVINEESTFALTEFKVLKSQGSEFVKCAKVLYNGKIKLVYFTSELKSLKNMMPSLDTDSFLVIISNLINAIINIKTNGFLDISDLDLSFEKIFVDQNTMEISLVYLPINADNSDVSSFENEFKTELIKHISTVPAFSNDKMMRVCGYLSNGMLSLNQLYSNIRSEISGVSRKVVIEGEQQGKNCREEKQFFTQPRLKFSSINAPQNVCLLIDSKEFTIGKSPDKANGAITFNNAISRLHCKISYQNNAYYITDLGSANGTFVNKTRISPQHPELIKSGDVIRLANSDFKVEF